MTLSRRLILAQSYLTGAVLLGYGVWFLVSPDLALVGTDHQLDALPLVMGGRYFFFGVMLICALVYNDPKVLATLLAGFAGLGLFDGVLYWSANPWPHVVVGLLSLAVALYYFKTGKVAG